MGIELFDHRVLGELDARATVVITIVGAAFGSFVAVALQAYVTRRGSKAHFRALLDGVVTELSRIAVEAKERSARSSTDLRLDASYPTSAWDTLVASPEVRRLASAYAPLAGFYWKVSAANHRTQQVAALITIAAIAPDDEVRLQYRTLAQQFSGPLHADLLDDVDTAKQVAEAARP